MAKRKPYRIKSRAKARSTSKAQLQATAKALAPMLQPIAMALAPTKGNGPVHICGTRHKSDGLTRLQRDLIREAQSIQACKAQAEVQASHMTVREHYGWTVHAYNPGLPEVRVEGSRVQEAHDYTTSNRYSDKLRADREQAQALRIAQRNRLREHLAIRNQLRGTN